MFIICNFECIQLLGELSRAGCMVGSYPGCRVRRGGASVPRGGHQSGLHCSRSCHWIWEFEVRKIFSQCKICTVKYKCSHEQ